LFLVAGINPALFAGSWGSEDNKEEDEDDT
jgi:hypothetical protein